MLVQCAIIITATTTTTTTNQWQLSGREEQKAKYECYKCCWYTTEQKRLDCCKDCDCNHKDDVFFNVNKVIQIQDLVARASECVCCWHCDISKKTGVDILVMVAFKECVICVCACVWDRSHRYI